MKFGLEQHIIDILITVFEQNSKVDKALVFGSRAKGNYRPDSDIDIAIKGQDLNTDDIIAMSVAFEEKGITHKIDLINYKTIKEPDLKDHINRVGIELYSRWKEYKTIDTPFGTIAEDWSYIPSLQFCTKITDGTHDSPKQQKSGKHLVTSKHIKGRNIDFETAYLISEKDFDNINLRSKVDQWDVIVSMIGEYCGFTYVERNESIDYAVKNVGLFKTGSEHKALWLFYYLNSKIGRHILEINKSGTSQPYLTLGFLRELPILYPSSIVEANHIIQILSSLDDKIDLLHRQNKTLEQLAETLFRQWFVEEAEDYELGCFGDVISIFDSLRVPVSSMEREKMKIGKLYPYYGAAKIMDYINDYIFDGEYVLMGEDGTVQTEEGFPILQMPTGKFWVNNHTHVLQAKKPYSNYLIYIFLKQTNINHIITGAVQPKINQENLKLLDFPILPEEKIIDFVKITNDYWEKIKSNQTQIRTLTQTRDTLLPKLMSGEVRVNL